MFEENISLLAYPIESVFAEKLHALVSHGKAIQITFGQRDQKFVAPIEFADDELTQLQKTWNLHRGTQKEAKLPAALREVIDTINRFLETI